MIILHKFKFIINNSKINLNAMLNLKLKSYNLNLILLYKIILTYINKYNINIFIIYIYSNKIFKILCNYSVYRLYNKYIKIFNIISIIYKIILYKKLQLLFYNIYQLINIIYYTILSKIIIN